MKNNLKLMKIGITTHSVRDTEFRVQLNSMLKFNVPPDFVIFHDAGVYYLVRKAFKFLIKTIKQYRIKSLTFILSRYKLKEAPKDMIFGLLPEENSQIDNFLNTVSFIKTRGINEKSTIETIKGLGAVIISCNSGILRKDVLALSNAVFLNIHAAKLPQYRGMSNVEWALFENNDIYVTVHKISRGIDEGDILYQEKIETENVNLKTINDYRNYCFFKSNEVLGKALYKYLNREITFCEQDRKGEPLLQYYVMHPVLRKMLQERIEQTANMTK
jgi:folate-dependent phosphoribosylglycinamide formyltransferase PurN